VINIRFWNLSRNPDKNPQKESELRRTKIQTSPAGAGAAPAQLFSSFFSFLCGAGTMPANCRLYYRKMVAVHPTPFERNKNILSKNLTRHRPHHGTPKSGMAEVSVHKSIENIQQFIVN